MGKNRTIRVLTSREAIPIDMLGVVLAFDIMRATSPCSVGVSTASAWTGRGWTPTCAR